MRPIIPLRLLRPSLVVFLASALYIAVALFRKQGDPFALLLGYDGMFYYLIAADPIHASPAGVSFPAVDSPPLRYGRPLFPALSWLLGLGNPALIPWAMIFINLVAIALGTELVDRLIRASLTRELGWLSLAFGLRFGELISLRRFLTEPVTYALVAAGVLLERGGRTWLAAGLLALAALGREQAALFTLAYVLGYALSRRRREAAVCATALLPLALLQVVIWRIFGKPPSLAGPPFEPLPFLNPYLSGATRLGMFSQVLVVLLPALALTAYAASLLWRLDRRPLVWAVLLNCLLLQFVGRAAWSERIASARISLGLVLATLVLTALRQDRTVLTVFGPWWLVTSLLYVLLRQGVYL